MIPLTWTRVDTHPDEDFVVGPDQRLSWPRTLGIGAQHVVAMFGATVLAPILMGFDPNTAIFFSGIGTLIFFLVTGGRVPSYLGSSFSFIAVVIAATAYAGKGGNPNIGVALGGIIAAGALYALQHNIDRLADDHANAQLLAQAVRQAEGLRMSPEQIDTNMVIFEVDPALGKGLQFAAALQAHHDVGTAQLHLVVLEGLAHHAGDGPGGVDHHQFCLRAGQLHQLGGGDHLLQHYPFGVDGPHELEGVGPGQVGEVAGPAHPVEPDAGRRSRGGLVDVGVHVGGAHPSGGGDAEQAAGESRLAGVGGPDEQHHAATTHQVFHEGRVDVVSMQGGTPLRGREIVWGRRGL